MQSVGTYELASIEQAESILVRVGPTEFDVAPNVNR